MRILCTDLYHGLRINLLIQMSFNIGGRLTNGFVANISMINLVSHIYLWKLNYKLFDYGAHSRRDGIFHYLMDAS